MHKQKKFLVWLSIWPSFSLLGMSSSLAEPKEEVGTTEKVQALNPWSVNDGIKFIQQQQWDKVVKWNKAKDRPPKPKPIEPKPQVQSEAQEPVIASSDGSCGPEAMSRAQAHSCWDALIQGPSESPYQWSYSKAFEIMYCESRGDYLAHNKSGANGLMQVMGGPYDPAANMSAAYELYLESIKENGNGWRPWVCA